MLVLTALMAVVWLTLAVLGTVLTGWFWLTVVGLALLLATVAGAEALYRPTRHPGT
ncbi:hypothetical protein ACI8AC_06855 [Geodermatophilus sp. SYSU D00758]